MYFYLFRYEKTKLIFEGHDGGKKPGQNNLHDLIYLQVKVDYLFPLNMGAPYEHRDDLLYNNINLVE